MWQPSRNDGVNDIKIDIAKRHMKLAMISCGCGRISEKQDLEKLDSYCPCVELFNVNCPECNCACCFCQGDVRVENYCEVCEQLTNGYRMLHSMKF